MNELTFFCFGFNMLLGCNNISDIRLKIPVSWTLWWWRPARGRSSNVAVPQRVSCWDGRKQSAGVWLFYIPLYSSVPCGRNIPQSPPGRKSHLHYNLVKLFFLLSSRIGFDWTVVALSDIFFIMTAKLHNWLIIFCNDSTTADGLQIRPRKKK